MLNEHQINNQRMGGSITEEKNAHQLFFGRNLVFRVKYLEYRETCHRYFRDRMKIGFPARVSHQSPHVKVLVLALLLQRAPRAACGLY